MSDVPDQIKFTQMIALMVGYATLRGWGLTYGDAYRDRRVTYGHPESLHRWRLAVDFNLFKDGIFVADGTGHDALHDYWDTVGGAPRIVDDMNHYSLKHRGMR